MYLAIIVLPLLGSIVSGFFGRKVGVSGSQIISCSTIIITTLLSLVAFFEVGLNNIPVSLQLFRWIDSESLNVLWGFHFDSLTVSMLIPVLIVSSLVHIYSIGYMSHDPHNQRFFSYLSLFTFMMIILVTANNFLLMFVGWEGNQIICPKWLIISNNSVLSSPLSGSYIFFTHTFILTPFHSLSVKEYNQKRFFFSNKIQSKERIGPHSLDLISLIVGSLLSNTYLDKRKYVSGIRIIFVKCSNNVEYLMWFHSFLAKRGYCSHNKPKLYKLITKGNKVLFIYSFNSYSFSSFIWLFNMFYEDNIKIIPRNLDKYLTPLALATWYLSDTGLGKKYKLTRILSVSIEDLKYLSYILKNKYNIETIFKLKGRKLAFKDVMANNDCEYLEGSLYIKNSSISTFSKIVKPHILPSLHYKLNRPLVKLSLPGNYGLYNYSTSHSPNLRVYSTKTGI